MREPKIDKSAIFISFHYGDTLIREYIPAPISKYELKAREKYRLLQNKMSVPHYYWHYRHLLDPNDRKIEDLKFLIHVYEEHGGTPIDDYERKYYRSVYNLYTAEFNTLILPKLELENEGRGITHPYANAYYKKWLREKNGNLSRLYHGVDSYEMFDMYTELINNGSQEIKKLIASSKYYDSKAKKKKSKISRKSLEAERKKYNLKRKHKFERFKQNMLVVDILLSVLFTTSYMAANATREPVSVSMFNVIFFITLLQIPLFFIYQFARDNFFNNLDE
jgi:hypothetical protein